MSMPHRLPPTLALLVILAACGGNGTADTTTTAAIGFPVSGYAHAGPVCPVEQSPPDPACADRPVSDALIVVQDRSGGRVAEVRTTAGGTFSVVLPPGEYTLIPQPVEGLLGTAAAQDVVVETGPVEGIDFSYDTGIR